MDVRGVIRRLGRISFYVLDVLDGGLDMSENPAVALRMRSGLSRREFAQRLGLSYSQWAALELGYPTVVSARVLWALHRAGVDAEGFARRYRQWRDNLAKEAALSILAP
ncbi:MAG TPA: helix-turn-helix transcriptional regulator [Thermaerobacter sp.]